MKKYILIPVLFVILILSGCSIIDNNRTKIDDEVAKKEASSPQQQVDQPDINSCAYWKDKDYQEVDSYNSMSSVKDKAGSIVVKGQILQSIEDDPFEEGKKVTIVYFVFYNPDNVAQQLFYNYYSANVANGNGINRIKDQKLLFRLGILNDAKLITSANINAELSNRLVSLIDTGNSTQLKLVIPIYNGAGAGLDFSFACDISE